MLSWRVGGVRAAGNLNSSGVWECCGSVRSVTDAPRPAMPQKVSCAPCFKCVTYASSIFLLEFFCGSYAPCEALVHRLRSPWPLRSPTEPPRHRTRGSQSAGTARPAKRCRSSMARLLLLICGAYALDRPTSRFQNAFGNRGSSVRRKRTLPVYRPPDSPATPLPVPGSSRTLRYQPEGAANAQLVRDLQQYGALVVVIGDGEDEPIGCVVDVRLAEVASLRLREWRVDGVSGREGAGWSLFRIRGRHRVSRRSPTRARLLSWLPVRPRTRACRSEG